jgi:hypothetical protein
MGEAMSKVTMRDSEADARELKDDELDHVSGGRTMPNGKTDVIKAMGNYDKPSPMEAFLHAYGFL